jgi:Xaa-Pro aminopeptidase
MKEGNLELEDKVTRLQRMLETEDLDGVLLNTQHNFAWLSCGGSNGIDLSSENGAGFLLVTRKGGRYLIANNIELERLRSEQLPTYGEFEPIEITWQSEREPQAILGTARSVAGKNLGSDTGFPETRWIAPSVAGCRAQLTPEEIERYKKLGREAGEALESVVGRLEPGQTENQIARIVRDELAAREIFSVVTLVGADERILKFRHPTPTDNIWRETLLVVTCARRSGLIANLTRMICTNTISDDLQRRTEAAAFVNASLYHGTKEGATAADLYAIASRAYAAAGFAGEIDKHHQGGACGYRPRDWVAHPDGSGDVVRMDQAFAWNPSITGTKTEETGILTAKGFEVITANEGFPKIPTVIDGREYLSTGVLSLAKGVSA